MRSAIAELKFVPNQAARALATSRFRSDRGARSARHHPRRGLYDPGDRIRRTRRGYRLTVTNLATSDPDDVRASIDHLMQQSIEGLIAVAPQTRVVPVLEN